MEKGLYNKVRIIRNYDNYDKLYVIKKGKFGYCISTSITIDLNSMIEVNGEYWFGTLKQIKKAIGI